MKPYKTKPVLKEKIWGTESWETPCGYDGIPLLVKFITTKDILSVQVHPDDDYARTVEGQPNGKAELWVVLDCAPDASIVYGFNRKMDKKELRELIDNGIIADSLKEVKVRKGDCFFIPPGTVHTLGKGITVYEVQQPSDITYRLYDWDRTDSDGNRRELHIGKAMETVDFSCSCSIALNIYDYLAEANINIVQIEACKFFDCIFLKLNEKETYSMKNGNFKTLSCITGNGKLLFGNEAVDFKKGDTLVIPEEWDEDAAVTSGVGAELIISSCKAKD